MTTPDTPEPTCETCGWLESAPCPECYSGRAPLYVVSGRALLHVVGDAHRCEGAHPFQPTEAPAPAAPSALEALRTILELIGIDDSEAAWRDATAVGWEAIAAARVPVEAAGEALEAAWEVFVAEALMTPADAELSHEIFAAGFAAARAPGPVGGE